MLPAKTSEFFEAISSTNYVALSRFLADSHFEPNCVDENGKYALQLAVDQEDCELIELLLPRANLRHVHAGLFTAITRDNAQAVALMLRSNVLRKKKYLSMLSEYGTSRDDSITAGPDPLRPRFKPHEWFRPEGNPLVLAAIRGNTEIVHLLVESGITIKRPHKYSCTCYECTNNQQLDFVHFSRARLASYSALATNGVLSLSDDPFLESFKLSVELDTLSYMDNDYGADYKKLAEACRIFAVDLFNQCQGSDETAVILSHGNLLNDKECDMSTLTPAYKLAAVDLAIQYGQKKFIAHPVTQRYALNEWYRGVEWLQLRGYSAYLLFSLAAIILYPFSSLVYLMPFSPSQVKIVMTSPYVKYLHRTVSYVTFLFIVFAALIDDKPDALWDYACSNRCCIDFLGYKALCMLWIFGFIASHIREIVHSGSIKAHVRDVSNVVDLLGLACFVFSFILNFVIAGLINRDPIYNSYYCDTVYRCRVDDIRPTGISVSKSATITYDLSQIADIFLAIGDMFTFARLLFVMPSSSVFGPLTIAFQRMLWDTISVLVLWAIIIIGFVTAIALLYLNYACTNSDFASVGSLLKTLFWSSFGIGEIDAPQISPDKVTFPTSQNMSEGNLRLQQIFINLSAQTVGVGYFLYGAYLVITAVVLVNMLVAIMSKTFDTIYNDRDAEWKFMRASLWMKHYESYNVLPIPFNLLEYVGEAVVWLAGCVGCRKQTSPAIGTWTPTKVVDETARKKKAKYSAVCALLVERLQHDPIFNRSVQDPLGLVVRGVTAVIDEQKHGADVVRNGLTRLEAAICRLAKLRHVNVPNTKDLFASPLRHRKHAPQEI